MSSKLNPLCQQFLRSGFGYYKRWRQSDRVSGYSEHDIMVVKSEIHGFKSTFTHSFAIWRQIDSSSQSQSSNIQDIRMITKAMDRIGKNGFKLPGSFKQTILCGRDPGWPSRPLRQPGEPSRYSRETVREGIPAHPSRTDIPVGVQLRRSSEQFRW